MCYTCVRECPAKAIRIVEGQAEVMGERCICCGNCVRVCSQNAKKVVSSVEQVRALLEADGKVVACVAPSFPAEFAECDSRRVVGMLRKLGFDYVNEVGFGADLVADRYRKLLEDEHAGPYIATSCPALVEFVERYHPHLTGSLAPIVSPMIAEARMLRRLHGDDLQIVFIGPCIAKKKEALDPAVAGHVHGVLTFAELREMLASDGITPDSVEPSDFDEPRAGLGALFPISRGLLQAANISEDLLAGQVVATEGRTNFVEALKEFSADSLDIRLLELLCCSGCIMGPGITSTASQLARRAQVGRYVRQKMADVAEWRKQMERFADLDLTRTYSPNDQRVPTPDQEEIAKILARMGKTSPADELNCGACGYDTCREHAVAIYKGLAESEMCLPYTIEQLRKTCEELAISSKQLQSTQEALMQSEKLASMGQLAAGIAHEVNNPLGVVLLYSHILLQECGQNPKLREDLSMIVEQADRCKKIVSELLHFARQNKVALRPTDLRSLVDNVAETLRLPDNVMLRVEHESDDATAEVDRDQIIQVLTNLVTNAVAAMPEGGTLTLRTRSDGDRVHLGVSDTGVGIPRENMSKIFEPFFTTKQIGRGTGLGLAVTYGIVKMHRGDISVESNADPAAGPTGTTFTVSIPIKGRREEPLGVADDTAGNDEPPPDTAADVKETI